MNLNRLENLAQEQLASFKWCCWVWLCSKWQCCSDAWPVFFFQVQQSSARLLLLLWRRAQVTTVKESCLQRSENVFTLQCTQCMLFWMLPVTDSRWWY